VPVFRVTNSDCKCGPSPGSAVYILATEHIYHALLQGVGYGDVPLEPGSGQFATTAIFSIILTILLTFFIKNFTELHAERKSLARMLEMAEKKQMLGCLKQMDMHKGVTKEAFTLAVLAQLGVLDRETDISPWYKVGVGLHTVDANR
jgi:hypothetical protein